MQTEDIKVGMTVRNNGSFNPASVGLTGRVLEVRGDDVRVRRDDNGLPVGWYPSSCDPVPVPPSVPHGGKDDSGKLPVSLLMQGMPGALLGVVKVLQEGAKKYAAHSWRAVPNGLQRYADAFGRHYMDVNLHGWDHVNTADFNLPTIDHMLTDLLFIRELLAAQGKIK